MPVIKKEKKNSLLFKPSTYQDIPGTLVSLKSCVQVLDEPLISQEITSQIQITVIIQNPQPSCKEIFVNIGHVRVLFVVTPPDPTVTTFEFLYLWRNVQG